MINSYSFKTQYFKKKRELLCAHPGNNSEFCARDTWPLEIKFSSSAGVGKLRVFNTQL